MVFQSTTDQTAAYSHAVKMAEFGPMTYEQYFATLSPNSAKVESISKQLGDVTELQTALAGRMDALVASVEAVAGAAGPTGSQQQDLQLSRNRDTGLLAKMTATFQSSLFKSVKAQKFELWLRHKTVLLETSGLSRDHWGVCLLSGLDTQP